MAVEFLTDEQAARYGSFHGVPSRAELERYFLLDDADREAVQVKRRSHTGSGSRTPQSCPPRCRTTGGRWRCRASRGRRPPRYERSTSYPPARPAWTHAEGHELRDEDIARLSQLKHRNLNLLGRYGLTARAPAAGALRPLRDPNAPEPDEDDDGSEKE